MTNDSSYDTALAIIGMSGKFPGAATLETFWQNIAGGIKSIRFFTDEEMLAAGIDPAELRKPDLVKAGGFLEDVEYFDAAFFGYTPREADIMDPQHRLMLECAWSALEDAAYVPDTYQGLIGIFAGSATSTYMRHNIYADPALFENIGQAQVNVGNDQDSLTTTISYKLNLRGPSIAVQTFCSTSLVAVHLACQSLLNGECDIALAGGVAINLPQESGYIYEEGGILSPDGECRTFDAQGQGSVMGNGAGCVVLKRFHDALNDGDHIYACIRGTAINNDGAARVSYTAPGLDGQANVVAEALDNADIDVESIGYIEAHGTATALGDMIELGALLKAFRGRTDKQRFCALGSVKPNVGHLDRAAGVTGLIKTALALQHQQIPPSLNFEQTSPDIQLEQSPFFINTTLRAWPAADAPRRAGVSSFGVGGTNVHVILEEAPEHVNAPSARPFHLLSLSARTETALEAMTKQLATHLSKYPEQNIADVAYTLQVGRTVFPYRRVVLCEEREDAIQALQTGNSAQVLTTRDPFRERKVAFLFPGVGEQYGEQAKALYRDEPDFREAVERCCSFLRASFDLDISEIFMQEQPPHQPMSSHIDFRAMVGRSRRATNSSLSRTAIAQPALFVFEYALACLLQRWGIQPVALLGYSLGEYVAACLSGILSLEDALTLVVQRARAIDELPAGTMLAVNAPEAQVQRYLSSHISLAAVNSPMTCVLAGSPDAIASLEQRLHEQEIACFRIQTTHAFHSFMLEPLRPIVTKYAHSVRRSTPRIPLISNVTGTWLTDEQALDPTYWAAHMCQTVQFVRGVEQLLHDPEWLVLEVGPGQGLSSFVKQHLACGSARLPLIHPLLPAAYDRQPTQAFLLKTLGKLWLAGVPVNWAGFHAQEQRYRVSLPTYPFERQRHWLTPAKSPSSPGPSIQVMSVDQLARLEHISDWFYLPSWKQGAPQHPFTRSREDAPRWLLFADAQGIGERLAHILRHHGHAVALVKPGERFAVLQDGSYRLNPPDRADYEQLFQSLPAVLGGLPTDIVHLWTVGMPEKPLDYGFYSLLALSQCLGNLDEQPCMLSIVSDETQEIMEGERLCPAKSAVMGVCRVIPQEYTHIRCRTIDIVLSETQSKIALLLTELTSDCSDQVVALRGGKRWLETFVPYPLPEPTQPIFRQNGVYLITGGLGGLGLAMAERLVQQYHAQVILTSRSALPPRQEWERMLALPDEINTRKLSALLRMEAHGVQPLVLSADVNNEEQMQRVFQRILETYGMLHGILHTAAVPAIGLTQFKTAEAAAHVLAPKVSGTLILEKLIRQDVPSLDFLLLFSSMSSITGGGPGQVDYSAANAFLGTYAKAQRHQYPQTLAVDWGEWQWNGWEAGLEGYDPAAQELFKQHRLHFGISFDEGFAALTRLLAQDQPHVIVSTQEFCTFAELSKDFTASTVIQYEREKQRKTERHPRPALSTSYSAPRNQQEQQIVAIWEDMLGITPIGIDDNFFDLGGNSLTGVAMIARLKKAFSLARLPAAALYEAPSVSAMAQYLKQYSSMQSETKDHAQNEWDERGMKRRAGLRQRLNERQQQER
ncbi:acyl transferase domain-containing protein [Thermosporothrix hazakensis]|jgi:acyl transferase domain-containing protein|uniref:Acyl transferase domain-containing protein n=1 Tax=Thermosporothrix hazakensis TaxID=644383 RepID=A0A326U412_THEHA|nr:type I polyketide synthase [Thermosporothrix hazakensis]PZW27159.1 acyl transferase domain-containing protein [Thermosporothrix hazakensis]GCE50443.1 polyketide synthase [Thermosporothrix hazakensis]